MYKYISQLPKCSLGGSKFVVVGALALLATVATATGGVTNSAGASPTRCLLPEQLLHGACVMTVLDAGKINRWPQARNSDNPYDPVGLRHNLLVANFSQSQEGMAYKADLLA